MKSNLKALTPLKAIAGMETPANNPQLAYLLSPLELAAYKHPSGPFTFYLHDEAIIIEPHMSGAIRRLSKKHVAALRSVLQRARQKELAQDPAIRRFLHQPLKTHNLPTRVYHVLRGAGCLTLADVANRGEPGLRRLRGMGNRGISAIFKLFNDQGCGSLFL
jgi:hypothetical protein